MSQTIKVYVTISKEWAMKMHFTKTETLPYILENLTKRLVIHILKAKDRIEPAVILCGGCMLGCRYNAKTH